MKWKKWLLTDIATTKEKDYVRRYMLFKRTINGRENGKLIELVTQQIPPFSFIVYETESEYETIKKLYEKEIE